MADWENSVVREVLVWGGLRVALPLLPYIFLGFYVLFTGFKEPGQEVLRLLGAGEVLFLGIVLGVFGIRERGQLVASAGKSLATDAMAVLLFILVGGGIFYHGIHLGFRVHDLDLNQTLPLAVIVTLSTSAVSLWVHTWWWQELRS